MYLTKVFGALWCCNNSNWPTISSQFFPIHCVGLVPLKKRYIITISCFFEGQFICSSIIACHKWHFQTLLTYEDPQLFYTIPVLLVLSSFLTIWRSALPSFPTRSHRSLMFVTGHDRWEPLSPRGSEAWLNWKLQMKSMGFKFISYYVRWPLAAADKTERTVALIQFSTLSTPLTSFTVRQPTRWKWKW